MASAKIDWGKFAEEQDKLASEVMSSSRIRIPV